MQTNNPIAIDSKVYSERMIRLAVSSLLKENFISASVSLVTTPVHRQEDGTFLVAPPEYDKTKVCADVYAENDIALQTCLYKVNLALQEYINATTM